MRNILVRKATGVDKAKIVANDTTSLRQFDFLFRVLTIIIDENKNKYIFKTADLSLQTHMIKKLNLVATLEALAIN